MEHFDASSAMPAPVTPQKSQARLNRRQGLRRLWPEISDVESARQVAKEGVFAAGFVAVLTTAAAILAITGNEFIKKLGIDAWSFLDAILFTLIALGIHRMSRIAAVAGLLLYGLETLFNISQSAGSFNPTGLLMGVVITLAFINAVRSTFKFRALQAASANLRRDADGTPV